MNRNRFLDLYATYLWPVMRRVVKKPRRCKKCILSEKYAPLKMDDAPAVSFCEQRKAKEELGYESRSLDAVISDCYRWLLKEGRIATGQPTR
jgi:nucleoside-diphosphate-sugar epimerase